MKGGEGHIMVPKIHQNYTTNSPTGVLAKRYGDPNGGSNSATTHKMVPKNKLFYAQTQYHNARLGGIFQDV
jgi:hypothetical protein